MPAASTPPGMQVGAGPPVYVSVGAGGAHETPTPTDAAAAAAAADAAAGGAAALEAKLTMPNKAQRATLFVELDYSGHGALSVGDVETGVIQWWPPPLVIEPQLVARAYAVADESGDGWIGRKDFRLFWVYLLFFHRQRTQFALIGQGGDRISLSRFRRCCVLLELRTTPRGAAAKEFARLDAEGDGFVSMEKFYRWAARSHAAQTPALDTSLPPSTPPARARATGLAVRTSGGETGGAAAPRTSTPKAASRTTPRMSTPSLSPGTSAKLGRSPKANFAAAARAVTRNAAELPSADAVARALRAVTNVLVSPMIGEQMQKAEVEELGDVAVSVTPTQVLDVLARLWPRHPDLLILAQRSATEVSQAGLRAGRPTWSSGPCNVARTNDVMPRSRP